MGVPVIAFLAVAAAGLGTAAAAGWLSPQARKAFDSPDARQFLRALYGSTADLDMARERVTAPGPDGSTIATWTLPVADRGTCTAILVSKKSAALPVGEGQRSDLPTAVIWRRRPAWFSGRSGSPPWNGVLAPPAPTT